MKYKPVPEGPGDTGRDFDGVGRGWNWPSQTDLKYAWTTEGHYSV